MGFNVPSKANHCIAHSSAYGKDLDQLVNMLEKLANSLNRTRSEVPNLRDLDLIMFLHCSDLQWLRRNIFLGYSWPLRKISNKAQG